MTNRTKLILSSIPKKEKKETANIQELLNQDSTSPFISFCRKDLLYEQNGRLYANWQDSFSGACAFTTNWHFIDKNAVIKIDNVGNCASGGWEILKFTHN